MQRLIRVGERIPPVKLGRIENGDLVFQDLEALVMGRRVVVVGVPGAWTPTCSRQHVPAFVANAPDLKRSGFHSVICLSQNDPWVLDEWSRKLDPEGRLMFLSDGNQAFGHATGLMHSLPDFFMGERLCRFVMVLQNAVVERINVEPLAATLTCTRPQDVLLAA